MCVKVLLGLFVKEYKMSCYIRIQSKTNFHDTHPGGVNNWKNWVTFSVWPIIFDTKSMAEDFMDACFTFKGIKGRKMSATICGVKNS